MGWIQSAFSTGEKEREESPLGIQKVVFVILGSELSKATGERDSDKEWSWLSEKAGWIQPHYLHF